MTDRMNADNISGPEHGYERRRNGLAPKWTPELRRHSIGTSIRLSAARLETPFNPAMMAKMIEDASLVSELGGKFFTLTQGTDAESYARNSILWAIQRAEREGIKLGQEVMEIARPHLRQLQLTKGG